jgi:amino acid transporter
MSAVILAFVICFTLHFSLPHKSAVNARVVVVVTAIIIIIIIIIIGIFLFTASRMDLGPTQPPIKWVPWGLSLGVKRPGREADHSPPSSAEVKE